MKKWWKLATKKNRSAWSDNYSVVCPLPLKSRLFFWHWFAHVLLRKLLFVVVVGRLVTGSRKECSLWCSFQSARQGARVPLFMWDILNMDKLLTCFSVTKLCNLALAEGRWCSVDWKMTAGLVGINGSLLLGVWQASLASRLLRGWDNQAPTLSWYPKWAISFPDRGLYEYDQVRVSLC